MVKRSALIVVGLGFGDEGKGLVTDYLCSKNKNPIVIRYNGGHQAGHCVVTNDGRKHVFSNFGAGSFRNIPTYWSSFCTFEPSFFMEEFTALDFNPTIYIDNKCPITTHYDVLYNRAIEITKGNSRLGSCGVGYGATIERQKVKNVSLYFKDLLNFELLVNKLKDIRTYYRQKINSETPFDFDSFSNDEEDINYLNSVKAIYSLMTKNLISTIDEKEIFSSHLWRTFVFEGAQGILLDENFGMKPFITKSNTTSKNALSILSRQKGYDFNIEIFYVTRAYQTRHGAGPFREKDPDFVLKNQSETNFDNQYQGKFRFAYLDVDLINYALKCDAIFSKNLVKNIVITCLDQLEGEKIIYYKNNERKDRLYCEITNELCCDFNQIIFSFSNCADFIDKAL